MKLTIKFLLSFFFLSIVTGCSNSYTLKDYPSKERFYSNFNKSVKNETLEITYATDSIINSDEGAFIKNDTLHFLDSQVELLKIKSVSYKTRTSTTLKTCVTGSLIGAFTGLLIGSTVPSNDHSGKAGFAFTIMSGAGAILGTIIGLSVEGRTIFYF